ncbi:MAG: AAA family ATPase [Oscillospiraceae bacterium]|nr:AAA family ATPase [Oscillospiraceae bacterium]
MSGITQQKLIIITGSPCVGKTTVTDRLFTDYQNSAFFDGDWAWCVNPFSLDDPRLRNGDKTMSFALSNYLESGFEYVFFSSVVVMYENIRANILRDITAGDYSVLGFTLTCSEETLLERHGKRGDENECSFEWLHLKPVEGDHVINTDNKSVEQIVNEMKVIIDGSDGA